MRVLLTSTTYLRMYFIKVIVLVLLSVCFSTTATYLSSRSFVYLTVCSLLMPSILESTGRCVWE